MHPEDTTRTASSKRRACLALSPWVAAFVAACAATEPPKPEVIHVRPAPSPEAAAESTVATAPPAGHEVRVAGEVACGSAVCRGLDEICCAVDVAEEGSDVPTKKHFCVKAAASEDPAEPWSLARQCAGQVASVKNVAAFACDDATDCGAAACGYHSAVDVSESRCGGGSIELCHPESGCRTAETRCRQGVPCPFFGDICETHGVCVTETLPTCGAQRCTESAPICCLSGSASRCSRDCDTETDLGFPVGTVECASAQGCGKAMDCCVGMGVTSSVCATFCDIGVQRVACDVDADCAPYEMYGTAKCASTPEGDLNLRFCTWQ